MDFIINIIIIDDEITIRNGLCLYFKNNLSDYFVMGAFDDGRSAIEYLKKEHKKIDVVLTDIKMNCVQGIELAKVIYENKWDIVTVLISGYKEFSYAKEAFKYNVFEYIEKPIDFDELDEIFNKISENINNKKLTFQKEYQDELKQLLISRFLIAVDAGFFLSEEQAKQQLKHFSLDESLLYFPCAKILLERDVEKNDKYHGWDYGIDGADNAIFNTLLNDGISLFNTFSNKTHLDILVIPKNKDFFGEYEKNVFIILENAKKELEKMGIKLENISVEFYDNLESLNESAKKMKSEINISKKKNALTMGEMDDFGAGNNENSEGTNAIINRALTYIKDNYNKDISLGDVAEFVVLSPVYFGRLFKMNIGESFTDYLLNIRLKNASELFCTTSMNVSEVSRFVGYDNVNYFVRLFRKKTGVTPGEYKNSVMKNI